MIYQINDSAHSYAADRKRGGTNVRWLSYRPIGWTVTWRTLVIARLFQVAVDGLCRAQSLIMVALCYRVLDKDFKSAIKDLTWFHDNDVSKSSHISIDITFMFLCVTLYNHKIIWNTCMSICQVFLMNFRN